MTATAEITKKGKVVWRVSYTVAQRRVRKTFKTREDARTWIEENSDIATNEGRIFWQAWRAITGAERHELMDSLIIVRKLRETDPDASLVDAARTYSDRRVAVKKSLTFSQAVDGVLASLTKRKRKGKVSSGWYDVQADCLGSIVRDWPDKSLVENSSEEIEIYLEDRMDDDDWRPRTFNNYWNLLNTVFKWAIGEGKLATNPMTKIEKFSKKLCSKEVIIPDVSLIARVLKLSQKEKYRPVRPAIDLGLGLMMRSSEISRTEAVHTFLVIVSAEKPLEPEEVPPFLQTYRARMVYQGIFQFESAAGMRDELNKLIMPPDGKKLTAAAAPHEPLETILQLI